MPPQIIHILCFFSGSLAAPDFVIKYLEVGAVQWPEIWKFIRVSYIAAVNDAQNVRVDTVCRKDNDQQNLSKMII